MRTHVILSAAVLALAACDQPVDVLWTVPVVAPEEIAPSMFRVTFNTGPDITRAITPDGDRIVYASQDPGGAPNAWRILSAPAAGGPAREEASLYRQAIRQPITTMVFNGAGRVIAFARPNGVSEVGCFPCFLPPLDLAVLDMVIFQLPAADGAPLSQVPNFSVLPQVRFPISGMVTIGTATVPHIGDTVRVTAAQVAGQRQGVNPFGPVSIPSSDDVYYSDGETVFRIDLAAGGSPEAITAGAFPAVSLDGSLLAVSRPLGLDSTTSQCSVQQDGGALCSLITITHTSTGWETVVLDRATLTTQRTVAGMEPRFHPDGQRLLVQRPSGLHWVNLSTGDATLVPESGGAYAPVISAQGDILAFTVDTYGNPDVVFIRLASGS